VLRVATWNVNSLKARLERVEDWVRTVQPDVLCMQETKLADAAFPAMAFQALGYEAVPYGEGRWNGVAIVSRLPVTEVTIGFSDGAEEDPEARLVWATCGGVRIGSVYVPNGREVGHEMFHYKLRFLERLGRVLKEREDLSKPLLLSGDFNIAPDDRDVHDPSMYADSTHVTPSERQALGEIQALGLVDVFREHYGAGGLFSWWDYRAGNFHKGKGMRIDLMLASVPLIERCTSTLIDRNARKGKSPSDHAPVIADFDL